MGATATPRNITKSKTRNEQITYLVIECRASAVEQTVDMSRTLSTYVVDETRRMRGRFRWCAHESNQKGCGIVENIGGAQIKDKKVGCRNDRGLTNHESELICWNLKVKPPAKRLLELGWIETSFED